MNPTLPTSGPVADAIAAQLAKIGKSSSIQTKTIAAGETHTFKVTGSFAYLVDCDVSLKWRMDGQTYIHAREGSYIKLPPGSYFEWIELLNDSGTEVDVTLYAGFAEYHEEREPQSSATVEPLTDSIARAIEGGTQLPAQETYTIEPLSEAPNVIQRKAVVITNRHATQELEVWAPVNTSGTSPYPMAIVWPRSTVILHVAGEVRLHNPSDSLTVPFYAGEIYYVTEPFSTE